MPTVLIIDDDQPSRLATADMFAREKWNVLEAKDGDDGIESALKSRPELILCDLLMPKANGFQVCRSIRQQLQPVGIIVISARDYAVDRASAAEAGADEYLVKPLTWENLSASIDRILPDIGEGRPLVKPSPLAAREAVRLRLWGVRGSIPVPGPSTLRYGGNTTCLELRADGEIIVLDAGSGIRPLGVELEREFGDKPMKLSVLISHSHWDHIQGLPFFLPAYNAKNEIRVFGYEGARTDLATSLAGQMEPPFFPVSLSELPAHISIEELKDMEFHVGKVRVEAKFLNHPGVCVGYRLFTSAGSIAFLPDNEPYEVLKKRAAKRDNISSDAMDDFTATERAKLSEFLRGSDILILDTQYTEEEYLAHVGWGHGCVRSSVAIALDAKVPKLVLFHHDPNHDDEAIDRILEEARSIVAKSGQHLEIEAASEGHELILPAKN